MKNRSGPSTDSFDIDSNASSANPRSILDTKLADGKNQEENTTNQNIPDENTAPPGFTDQVLLDQVASDRNAFDFSHFLNQLLHPPQHATGKMTDKFKVEGKDSLSDLLSDQRWGFLKIPDECDATGRMVEWTSAQVKEVQPYTEEEIQDQQGGSGILDTNPSALQYLRLPTMGTPPPVDEELHEQRKWFFAEELLYEDPSTFFPTAPEKLEVWVTKEDSQKSSHEDDDENSSVGDQGDSHDLYGYAAYLSNFEGQHGTDLDGPYGDGNHFGSREYAISSDAQSDSSLELESEPTIDVALVSLIAKFHLSEPETYSRVVISTSEGLEVCFDMPKEILFTRTGKPVKKRPYNIDTGSRVCFTLITSYHITNVESFVSGLTDEPVFDIAWVQNNARRALLHIAPAIQYYVNIQDLCQNHPCSVLREDLDLLFHMLRNDLPRHYLLKRPLATPSGTLEEKMADGSIMMVEEAELTVAQFIKRLYLESKLREHELRRVHELDHPDEPQPAINAMEDAPVMFDNWNVAERVKLPEGFSHYRGNPFDLQQIDWDAKVGIDASQARDARDVRQTPFYNLHWEDSVISSLIKFSLNIN